MTKILILTPDLKLPGGVSNFIKLLSKELNEEKFEIKYLFVGKTGIFFKDLFYPLLILINIIRLKKLLKNFQPDIVHINPSLTYAAIIRDFLFLKIIKKQGYPVLFFIHGWQKKVSKQFENILCKNYFKKRFEMADALVVLAKEFKKELTDLGINDEKICVLSTMVESNLYLPEEKTFSGPYNVLFCANMKREKGPFEIIDAAPIILNKFPNTKFIFIGGGKDLIRLKKKSKGLEIEKYTIFTGYLSIENKVKLFKNSHIFIFPSFHGEGFPTVILEAMAAGIPIITTPIAGLADAIENNKEGLILKTKPSANEVANKIIQLLENPNLMKKMSGNNMREAKEKYDDKIVTKKIIEIYSEIV